MVQQTVRPFLALGNAGEVARNSANVENYTIECIVADEHVVVGGFVQRKTDGTAENEVIGASGQPITGDILGVVRKNQYYAGASNSDMLPVGAYIQVQQEGTIFIECENDCKAGDRVYLQKDNGALIFDSEKKLYKDGCVFTGFVVEIGNNTGGEGIIAITSTKAGILPEKSYIE